jgi:NADPH2:quinone reductase
MMRAAYIEQFGDIDRINIVETPIPKPKSDEVLLKVEACGLNFADVLQRQGAYLGGPKPPYIPGIEAAGRVEAVGSEAGEIKVGDRIAGLARLGMHAEYAVVLRDASLPLPESIPCEVGVAIPVHYVTAYYALVHVARAVEGETVLIHAAGGGLGTAAVQIAKLIGLRVVGTSSTDVKRRKVEQLGADVVSDYAGFEQAVRTFTNGRGCDIILESIGGQIFRRSVSLLPPLGRIVILGIASKEPPAVDSIRLLYRSISVHGFHLNTLVSTPKVIRSAADKIIEWITSGKIHIQIGHTFALSDIRSAHKLMEERNNYGKIILIP